VGCEKGKEKSEEGVNEGRRRPGLEQQCWQQDADGHLAMRFNAVHHHPAPVTLAAPPPAVYRPMGEL
jgi:hypothetical protein